MSSAEAYELFGGNFKNHVLKTSMPNKEQK